MKLTILSQHSSTKITVQISTSAILGITTPVTKVNASGLKELNEFKLPKWNGLMRTWFPFAHQVELTLAYIGLFTFIEGPKAQETKARKDWMFSLVSYTKYDTLFFHALSEAICHKESKQPRNQNTCKCMQTGTNSAFRNFL